MHYFCKMEINIDKNSGFCFGVLNAITVAEEQLKEHGSLFCLGEIVHNKKEVDRLCQMGLIIINHEDLKNLRNARVLIRAHGEPPQTYEIARKNHIEIIDASCPVVLKLQNRIKKSYTQMEEKDGQLVIFGKAGHAEVEGLVGQAEGKAIVIGNDFSGLDTIDFTKPITLYSQTTQNKEEYQQLTKMIKERLSKCNCTEKETEGFTSYNTICGQVSNRGPHLADFARQHDVVIFVSGRESSNGKYLYGICKEHNPRTWFVSGWDELRKEWFADAEKTGICGATSTPLWLMEEVAEKIRKLLTAT